MKNTQSFTEGPIFGKLMRFALPVLLALFLQTMYGAVDLLVVGQFASAADVSAVATGSQVMQTLTLVITGLATPCSTMVQILLCGGFFIWTLRRERAQQTKAFL